VCRNGAIFQSHFKMNRECPRCHVIFWKDPGETLGASCLIGQHTDAILQELGYSTERIAEMYKGYSFRMNTPA